MHHQVIQANHIQANHIHTNVIAGNQYNYIEHHGLRYMQQSTILIANVYYITERNLEDLHERDLEAVRCDVDAICLPNTRQTLLRDIKQWVVDVDGRHVLWLCGSAGSGKSTVANTIASHFDQEGHLRASF